MTLTRKLLHVGATALMLSTVATVTTFVSADAAYAERGGNGNGNGNGRANRDRERTTSNRGGNGNGRGAVASELKGLNAAHSFCSGSGERASENSMPGKLYAYKSAADTLAGLQTTLQEAQDEFTRLSNMSEDQKLAEFNNGAEPPVLDEDAYTTALGNASAAVSSATSAVSTQTAIVDAALVTLGADNLSDAAMEELNNLLSC